MGSVTATCHHWKSLKPPSPLWSKKLKRLPNPSWPQSSAGPPPDLLSLQTAPKKTSFGSLKDEDRIFTNLYGRHDWR